MSKLKTLGAFTEMTGAAYPPYFNATHDLDQDIIVLTIRPEAEVIPIFGDPDCTSITQPSRQALSILSPDEFCRMVGEIISNCDDDMKDRIIRYATEVE